MDPCYGASVLVSAFPNLTDLIIDFRRSTFQESGPSFAIGIYPRSNRKVIPELFYKDS